MSLITVTVNGAPRQVPYGTTVAGLVAVLTTAETGIAVAVNDQVVRRGDWAGTAVRDADRLEILTAVQGG